MKIMIDYEEVIEAMVVAVGACAVIWFMVSFTVAVLG